MIRKSSRPTASLLQALARCLAALALVSLAIAPAASADRKPLIAVAGQVKQLPAGDELVVNDDPYDATGWNGDLGVPTKNAVRDQVEAIIAGGSYTAENARDDIGAALVAGTNVTITPNDGADTITIDASGAGPAWEIVDQSGAEIADTTVTITIASPGVVTQTAHGFAADTAVRLFTTGALPTGLTAGTVYYVRNPAANTYELSATVGGASINTSGTQSGAHTARLAASWTWSANVAGVTFTGLAGAKEIEIMAVGTAVSVSGVALVQVSTNNGSSYWTTSGDYKAIDAAGTSVNTIGLSLYGTNSTAARSGVVTIPHADVVGAPRSSMNATPNSTPLRLFTADDMNDIDALQVVPSAGGNFTAGQLYVKVLR